MSAESGFDGSGQHACPTCGDGFKNQHGMRIHHAQIHDERLGVVEKTCQVCSVDYETIEIRSDQSHYCSNECKHEARRERTTITCAECGAAVEVRHSESHQMYCSEACYTEAKRTRQGKDANGWRGGPVTLTCEICADEFDVDPNMADYRVTCSRECFGEHRSNIPREDHPRYIGGSASGHFRQAVRRYLGAESWPDARARHLEAHPACQMCGDGSDDPANHVHHIVPLLAGGTNAPELLMTLCPSCHKKAESYTDRFMPRVISDQ